MITGRRIGIGLGVLPDGVQDLRHKFAWLSHDDLYKPEKIELQVKAALDSGDRTTSFWSRRIRNQRSMSCTVWMDSSNRPARVK